VQQLSEPLLSIVKRRGVTDLDAFLRQSTVQDLPAPFSIPGIEGAARQILAAVQEQKPIAIAGDLDVDGLSGVTILKSAFKLLGVPVVVHVPTRADGYGLKNNTVFKLARDHRTRMLITVDNGINAARSIQLARRLGIESVVIDHHTKTSPEPVATVVWNRDYCGAGLALMVSWGILSLAGDRFQSGLERIIQSLSTLAALASIGDCVPLLGATRTLTRLGLTNLARTKHAGLARLLLMAGVRGRIPTASDCAFNICPRINAAGRLSDPNLVLRMFEARGKEAINCVTQLDEINRERKSLERKLFRELLQVFTEPVRFAFVAYRPDWPKGMAGLIASRAVSHFEVPSFVLVCDQKTGLATGSGRAVPGFDLVGALTYCKNLLTQFGGHQQAAGVSLPVENIPGFQEALVRYAMQHEWPAVKIEPDAEIQLSGLDRTFEQELAALEPFGVGWPPPIFEMRNARIVAIDKGKATILQGNKTIAAFTRQLPVPVGYHGTLLVEISSRACALKAIA
jgi:single-stranded-DNA-specific exonuclease